MIIGTEEECYAALFSDPTQVMKGESVTASQLVELEATIRALVDKPVGPNVVVLKRGPRGVTIYERTLPEKNVAGFEVGVLNTVGAGDAFASGLLYGYAQNWKWQQTARFANACGAIVVTRHGCGTAMPTFNEVFEFMETRGGM